MNFFEHQDRSRRSTKKLVVLFTLAVVAICVAVYLAFLPAALHIFGPELAAAWLNSGMEMNTPIPWWRKFWIPKLFFYTSVGTVSVIGLGTLYMTKKLSVGGSAVAEMMGGRRLSSGTKDPHELRLRNVVEEMAIASGTPMPEIYILDQEEAINAFAAGFTPSDSVIGVTKGTIKLLSRDELQGVIAHEFSHILNGDMRLNLRLTGILHGILCIGLIGYMILRGGGRHGSSSRRGGGGAIYVFLIGLALWIVGYVGVFFGKLIKSGVSRSREYLADASAVQFTRNPEGIVGALKKIGGHAEHAKIQNAKAEAVSHMFFGSALSHRMAGWLATHPPLLERIRRIDPYFKGAFPKPKPVAVSLEEEQAMGFAGKAAAPKPSAPSTESSPVVPGTQAATGNLHVEADAIADQVGHPTEQHLDYATGFLASLSNDVAQAAHQPSEVRAIVYSMLLDEAPSIRDQQLEDLKKSAHPLVYEKTVDLSPQIHKLGTQARLPLIDLALPALRELSRDQYDSFEKNVLMLIRADKKISLFEFVLSKVLIRHVKSQFTGVDKRRIKHRFMKPVINDCAMLLSVLANEGHENDQEAQHAFSLGLKRITAADITKVPFGEFNAKQLNRAMAELAHSSPSIKRELLEAATATVAADGRVTIEEAELLRAIGDTLDCPIPPILS